MTSTNAFLFAEAQYRLIFLINVADTEIHWAKNKPLVMVKAEEVAVG